MQMLLTNIIHQLQETALLLDLIQITLILAGTAVTTKIIHWINQWMAHYFIKRTHTQLDDPSPQSYFLNFGDSSLDMRVVCRVAIWGDQWRVAEEIRMEIYRKFSQEGIEIPFPQRVITFLNG